jgi:hypothetical protein
MSGRLLSIVGSDHIGLYAEHCFIKLAQMGRHAKKVPKARRMKRLLNIK